jgi:hypothetical protein
MALPPSYRPASQDRASIADGCRMNQFAAPMHQRILHDLRIAALCDSMPAMMTRTDLTFARRNLTITAVSCGRRHTNDAMNNDA